MSAKSSIAADPAGPASPRPLTRRAGRRPAHRVVSVRSSHGDEIKASLHDISIYGCNVICAADWLKIGLFVSIRATPDRAVQAIVRWSRAGSTGVEFLRPITRAEAEDLARYAPAAD